MAVVGHLTITSPSPLSSSSIFSALPSTSLPLTSTRYSDRHRCTPAIRLRCSSSSSRRRRRGLISSSFSLVSSSISCILSTPTRGMKKSSVLLNALKPDSRRQEIHEQRADDSDNEPSMDELEREEMRRIINRVIDQCPDVEKETDPVERKKKAEALLREYPLVVEEEDPDWTDEDDGWGFKLSEFFDNKISIKNVKNDDEDYDSGKEIQWKDDNYIREVKDRTGSEWEQTVFKDIGPLMILVHHRYKRPKENERARNELEKAVQIFWKCGMPAPRCIAIDAVVDPELASAMKVSTFPQLLFTEAGKILYRQTDVSSADDLSKIMAFLYCGAARPSCLEKTAGDGQEFIPSSLPPKPTKS